MEKDDWDLTLEEMIEWENEIENPVVRQALEDNIADTWSDPAEWEDPI